MRLNDFHAKGLAPSGGHILSSPAKKEYGKKDAAQGGVFPALRTHPLGWVSVAWVAWYGLPDKLASASVPCKLVSRPLAAALALTTLCASLQAAVVGGFLILISSRQACWRPPGALFFLLRRRKNRGRKTPLRAGGPALRTHPWYGVGTTAAHCTGYQANLQVHPCPDSW